MPFFHSCAMISSTCIFKMSSLMTFLSSFPTSLISSMRIWSVQFLFHFSVYLLPVMYLHHLVVQHMAVQFVPTLSTLLHCYYPFLLAVHSVSHNIQTTFVILSLLLPTMLLSLFLISNVCGLNPFIIPFT